VQVLSQLFLTAHRVAADHVEHGGLAAGLHIYAAECIPLCSSCRGYFPRKS
jgi:hypothetical protein